MYLRLVRIFLAALWLLMGPLNAAAQAPALTLDGQDRSVEVWPSITLLSDPSRRWGLAEVLARRHEFGDPKSAYANLGVRRDAVWLRLPLMVPENVDGRWVLNINYPALHQIDVHILREGRSVEHAVLGEQVPYNLRVMASRTHAMPLSLEPGHRYEVFMRIESSSSLVLPITLVRMERFQADEARTQMAQGLLTGMGLCLLVYSLAQWLSVRDRVFVHYAAVVFGTTFFFFVHFGFAQQHLWPDRTMLNFSPAAALVANVGGFLFTERVLDIRSIHPRLGRAMVVGSVLSAIAVLAFLTGLINYRMAHLASTLLGPWPLVLALPAAFIRARRGERVARFVLVGWSVFALSTIEFVGLLRGVVPANLWSRHFFQFGTIFEMCVWMWVLGIRSAEIRRAARRLNMERKALKVLAHTDPLTGLPNRRGLSEAARTALASCTADKMVAIYVLDLDGFKAVNDRHGHDVGDELLVAVGRRLKGAVRATDLVARLGGDEFVIMAQGLAGEAEAQRLGRKLLTEFQHDFDLGGKRCHVGLTVGYALSPADASDVTVLLKRADAAMYCGKQAGRNCLWRGDAETASAVEGEPPKSPQAPAAASREHIEAAP